jgi:DNA helicase-2/ATP-dependent DNA helicase PcrA
VSFSKYIFDCFPVIRTRISLRYQHIFIDEYQDTMADVLNIFYDAVAETNSQLYLFGDRMQQIYRNYDGSFEEQFALFDMTKMTTNYRSATEIVNILNGLYHDSEFAQDNSDAMKSVTPDFPPRVIIASDVSSVLANLQRDDPEALVLYLLNKERFSAIGASTLFGAFSKMEKYSYGKTYSAVDVLTASYEENPDPLLKLSYCVVSTAKNFQKGQYGPIIQTLKSNKSMFCQEICGIKKHSDKIRLFQNLTLVFAVIQDETKTISDLLLSLEETSLADKTYVADVLADKENKAALAVPAIELMRVLNYLDNPRVSTQHGVKGESHNSVIFVADDSSSTPIVYMYRFFDLLCQIPVSLHSFNQFYYAYVKELSDLQNSIKMKIRELKSADYNRNESVILQKANSIVKRFSADPYFQHICQEKYVAYLTKPGVTKAKECLKESSVLGILSAYKLFYVGCSRARRNLTILLDRSKIQGDLLKQKEKLKELGFSVEEIAV